MNSNSFFLSTRDAMDKLKISSCDLMHYRTQGRLEFEKRGNAYFYSERSLEKLEKPTSTQRK